jgi:hypothetical protein
VVGAVAQHPRFADRSIAWKRRGEQAGQAAATPQAVLIDRFEPQRIQPCFIHCARLSLSNPAIPRRFYRERYGCTQLGTTALTRQPRLASIRCRRWHRRLSMTVWNPRQIATQNVDGQGRSHENRSYPEAPVTMHPPPIWTRTRFAAVAAISFMVVLVSCHFVSIAWGIFAPARSPVAACAMNQSLLRRHHVALVASPNL